jgi:hypothetical protein
MSKFKGNKSKNSRFAETNCWRGPVLTFDFLVSLRSLYTLRRPPGSFFRMRYGRIADPLAVGPG